MAKERIVTKDNHWHVMHPTYEWDRETGELKERDILGCTHDTGYRTRSRDEAIEFSVRITEEKHGGKVERVDVYDESGKLIRSEPRE